MSDSTWDFEKEPTSPPLSERSRSGRPVSGSDDRRVIPASPPQRALPAPSVRPVVAVPTNRAVEGSYLPPTPPPGTAPSRSAMAGPPGSDPFSATQGSDRRASSASWGWRALIAFVAGGSLAAAGFAAAQWDGSSDSAAPVVAESTPVAAQPVTPPIVVEPPDFETDEPVAFVAQILGPSVVQVEIPIVGLGSGVVFGEGLILTNHHVIEGSTTVDIRTSDGRLLEGEVLGSDARTDIAVISVGPGSGLPVATLAVGDELEVGQLSIAIGSPFQLQQTVTSGIISALDRPIYNGVGLNAMIQTDAAINPGNSGGALADRNGRVIGINTAIQTDGIGNSNIGVGFAVPIDTAMSIADRILSGQPIEPGFLGVAGEQAGDGAAGVVVTEVTAGSAAEDAGVEVGDRIVTINGAPVTSLEELAGLLQTQFPGDAVELQIVRDGETIFISATLGGR